MAKKCPLKAAMKAYEDSIRSEDDLAETKRVAAHLERELKLFTSKVFKMRLLKARAKFCLNNAHRYV